MDAHVPKHRHDRFDSPVSTDESSSQCIIAHIAPAEFILLASRKAARRWKRRTLDTRESIPLKVVVRPCRRLPGVPDSARGESTIKSGPDQGLDELAS